MQRTDPPASSMVGTASGSRAALRSITAFCAGVRLAAARADSASKLLDAMSLLALGETLPEPARTQAVQAVNAWSQATTGDNWRTDRVRTAALLVFASPQFQVPR